MSYSSNNLEQQKICVRVGSFPKTLLDCWDKICRYSLSNNYVLKLKFSRRSMRKRFNISAITDKQK